MSMVSCKREAQKRVRYSCSNVSLPIDRRLVVQKWGFEFRDFALVDDLSERWSRGPK